MVKTRDVWLLPSKQSPEKLERIIDKLIPRHDPSSWLFSVGPLGTGSDGISNRSLKYPLQRCSGLLMQKCLVEGVFPEFWKWHNLVCVFHFHLIVIQFKDDFISLVNHMFSNRVPNWNAIVSLLNRFQSGYLIKCTRFESIAKSISQDLLKRVVSVCLWPHHLCKSCKLLQKGYVLLYPRPFVLSDDPIWIMHEDQRATEPFIIEFEVVSHRTIDEELLKESRTKSTLKFLEESQKEHLV